MTSLQQQVARGEGTTGQALEIFDALPAADLDFMQGRWHGAGFHTGHRLDGMLEAFGWYGKEFRDPEHVHPLIFKGSGGSLFTVHPGRLPMSTGLRIPVPKVPQMHYLFLALRPIIGTRQHRARLRMLDHRGRLSAAMIYDDLPIIDVFRRVDDNTLFGLMDLRGIDTPFFFRLMRD